MKDRTNIIGYSGHAFVAIECIKSLGGIINGYCDIEEKVDNPYNLLYLGKETDLTVLKSLERFSCFIAIGDNIIREKIYLNLSNSGEIKFINAIHKSALISPTTHIGKQVMISPNVCINALAQIGTGVICNTASIIEHECKIGNFAHIAPGATLAGNVTVGARSFIGANSVIREGIKIGKDVIVGAGSVVIKDIPNGQTVVGNPAQLIKIK
jgi:sugar O-acyltransferase (sialic acid O-acetyltransferase NeuD family)